MGFTLAEAVIKLSAPSHDLRRDLREAEAIAERVARTILQRFQSILSPSLIFKGLITGAGAAFGQLLNIGIDHIRQLDAARARFAAATGASRAEAEQAARAIRQAFRTNLDSVESLTDAMIALRREMGLTTAQAAGSLQTFLDFAKVTGQDNATAIRALDDVMDAWGLTIEDAVPLMDRLKRASELTGADIQAMQAVIASGAGQFQALGFSLDETIALLGKMAQAGVDPARAMFALAQATAKVKTPEELDRLARKIGAIQDPAARAQAAIQLFGIRAGPAMARLLDEGGFSLGALVRQIQASEGAVARASREFDTGINVRMELMRRRVVDAASAIAGPFLEAMGNVGVAMLGLRGMLPVLSGGFALLSTRAIPALVGALRLVPAAVVAVTGALGPVGLVIAGLSGAITLFTVAWQRNWLGIRDIVGAIVPSIAGVIDGLIGRIRQAVTFVGRLVERAKQAVGLSRQAEKAPLEAQRAAERAGFERVARASAAFTRKAVGGERVDLGLGGKQATNEALQNALRLHEALVALDRLTLREQISNLQRIKAAHAKTAEERLDLDVRIHRARKALLEEEARANIQAVEDSLQFIQSRLIAAGAPAEEVLAAFQRVIARIRAARDADFVDAKGKAEALKRVQGALADFQFQAQQEAADRIRAIRRSLTEEIERLTLTEFEAERRAINRRFDEQAAEIKKRLALSKDAAAALVENERARAEAIAAVNRREALAVAEQEARLAEIRRSLGQATIQDVIAAEERLRAALDPRDRLAVAQAEQRIAQLRQEAARQVVEQTDLLAGLGRATVEEQIAARRALLQEITDAQERLRIETEIRDLIRERAQRAVEEADAQRTLAEQARDEREETRRHLAAIIEQQIAARQALLAEITDQREKSRVLAEIRDLQRELVVLANAFDPGRGLRLAIEDALRLAFNWRDAWLDAIRGVTGQFETFFASVRTGQKDVLTALRDLALGIIDEVLRVIERAIAQQLVQRILQRVQGLLPGLQVPGLAAGPDMAAATAAAGAQVATAITTSGATASTAITTAGTAMAQAIVAAGQTAAAAISAAAGAGAGLFNLFGLQRGGVLRHLRVAAAQVGLVAHRPLLAALAEAGGTEVALPLPRGLRPEDLARWVRMGAAAERGGVQDGPINITIANPVVRSDRDLAAIARTVGDAVRWAKRGFHPVMREAR
jgi:hypothetical protein